jgi:hypothetical protein
VWIETADDEGPLRVRRMTPHPDAKVNWRPEAAAPANAIVRSHPPAIE